MTAGDAAFDAPKGGVCSLGCQGTLLTLPEPAANQPPKKDKGIKTMYDLHNAAKQNKSPLQNVVDGSKDIEWLGDKIRAEILCQ